MTKIVSRIQLDANGEILRAELGRFELVGDEVVATYANEMFRAHVERTGIMVADATLRPSDGQRVYDAIDRALSTSSRLVVETID